jgi:hypothetical protein
MAAKKEKWIKMDLTRSSPGPCILKKGRQKDVLERIRIG